jgi:hypothetical protein
MQAYQISDGNALISIIEKIAKEHSEETVVFRGQQIDRALIPSILRKDSNPAARGGCIPWLMMNWQAYVKKLVEMFEKSDIAHGQIDAVMQHYGYRSFFVDVTLDIKIALWFALHKFHSDRTPCYVDEELKSAIYQWARFYASDNGVVYVIAIPKESSERFINLTKTMPKEAARIHCQSACALYYSRNLKPLDDFIVAKIEVTDKGWYKGSNLDLKSKELFPLPKDDLFYRRLCTIPYYVSPESQFKDILMGHPLLGYFPIYADSPIQLVKEFVPLTRLIDKFDPSKTWSVLTSVADFEEKRCKVSSSAHITLYWLILDKLIETEKYSKRLADTLPSSNILLQFPPEASQIEVASEKLEEIIRGYWILIGNNTIRIAHIIDDFKTLSLGHACIYSKENLNLINKSCKCTTHESDLNAILAMSQFIENGTLVLNKDKNSGGFILDLKE